MFELCKMREEVFVGWLQDSAKSHQDYVLR